MKFKVGDRVAWNLEDNSGIISGEICRIDIPEEDEWSIKVETDEGDFYWVRESEVELEEFVKSPLYQALR